MSDEDALMRNVSDLRRRLQYTERSLHNLSNPDITSSRRLYRQPDEESSNSEQYATGISMDDLMSDTASEGAIGKMNGHGRHGSMMNASSYGNIRQGFSLQQGSRTSSYTSVSGSEYDDALRKKLHILRDENSKLISQNHELMNQLENAECEVMSKDNQVKMLSLELETYKQNQPNLEDRLMSFESEIQAQDKALRNAENRLDECQRDLSEKEKYLKKTREELRISKTELLDAVQQQKRAENQRDEALQNLEELNDQLSEYRTKTKDKMRKLQNNEEHLRDSLLHTDKEREELLDKAATLEAELEAMRMEAKRLQEERSFEHLGRSDSETMNMELRTQVSRQSHKITELEIEVDKKTREVSRLSRQLETKARECVELQDMSRRQTDRLTQCQREIEHSHLELRNLESIAQRVQDKALATSMGSDSGLSTTSTVKHTEFTPTHSSSPSRSPTRSTTPHTDLLNSSQVFSEDGDPNLSMNSNSGRAIIAELKMKLAMKEAEIQRLQSQKLKELSSGESQMDGLRSELMAVVEKSKMGDRKSHELEEIINRLEDERGKRAAEVLELEEKANEKDLLSSSLESRLNQCNNHISELQKEVNEKCDDLAKLDREVRKRNGQISNLERQLDEKVSAYAANVTRMNELEAALKEKTLELGLVKGQMDDRSEEFQQTTSLVEKIKELHAEQCKELEQQIEMLQRRCEEKNTQLQEMESSMATLQSELAMKSTRTEHLEKALQDCRQELSGKMQEQDQAWHILQQKANEGSTKVAQLESALVVCKEELKLYIDQLEESRDRHERQVEKKNEEVRKLDKLLKQSRHDLNERENQILELQQTLHERQQMLQQSTGRIGELEDSQMHLEQQVSQLEKELSQYKSTAIQEVDNMEKKLHQACLDLEERTVQIEELTQTLNGMQDDLKQSTTRINELDKLLQQTQSDNENKDTQLRQLDTALKDTKKHLEQKTIRVSELEERLYHMEEELQLHQRRSGQLDSEVKRASDDLQEAMQQLEEFQHLLQNSKQDMQRKDDKISELDQNLKEANKELVNRDQELTDLDHALKERQWELKQRAAQVTQLDMTMKEHRSEMEQKVMRLEAQLNKSQCELKERAKQIADLDDKLQQQKEEEREKGLQLQQLEQTIQRQKNEVSQKTDKISALEKKIKEQSCKIENQRDEELEQGQQLRITREQMQRQHMELNDVKKQLAQAQREKDRLTREVEEAMQVWHSKEADCARMADELGTTRGREAAGESRFMAEIQRMKASHELDMKQKDLEISSLQESHASLLTTKNASESNHRLELQQQEEKEKELKQQMIALEDKLTSLENELRARQDVIDAANEALVIKEAEVARLNAKISGYERATFGVRNREWTPSASTHQHPATNGHLAYSMPPLLPPLGPTFPVMPGSRTNLRRSTSDFSLAEQSTLNMSGIDDLQSEAGTVNTTRGYYNPPNTYISRAPGTEVRASDLYAPKQSPTQSRQDSESRHPGSFQSMLQQANQEFVSSVPTTPSRYSPPSQNPEVPMFVGTRDAYERGRTPFLSHSVPSSPAKPPTRSLSPDRYRSPEMPSRSPMRTGSGLYRASSQPQLYQEDVVTPGLRASSLDRSSGSPIKSPQDRLDQPRLAIPTSTLKSTSPVSSMTPEEYMAHLQDRLRVNEERRRRIDEQLESVRVTAKEAHLNGGIR
ncbi:uncharacterized protein LOC144440602 [Glandiceps talaboti]